MRASALCKVGLFASSRVTSRSSCGSPKAFHHSVSARGAASALRPSFWGAISTCDTVVGGASTQAASGSARSRAQLFLTLASACDGPVSPDSPFLKVTTGRARQVPEKSYLFCLPHPVRQG